MQQSYHPPGDYNTGSIQYRWNCSRCAETHSETRGFSQGDCIWLPPSLPDGWHKVDGEVFCSKHSVVVIDV